MTKTPIKDLFESSRTFKYYEDEMDRILFHVTNGDETKEEYSRLNELLYDIDSIYEEYRDLNSFEEVQEKLDLFAQKQNISKEHMSFSISNDTETGLLTLSCNCYDTSDESKIQEKKDNIYNTLFHLIIKTQRPKIREISRQYTYALFKTRFNNLNQTLSSEHQLLLKQNIRREI